MNINSLKKLFENDIQQILKSTLNIKSIKIQDQNKYIFYQGTYNSNPFKICRNKDIPLSNDELYQVIEIVKGKRIGLDAINRWKIIIPYGITQTYFEDFVWNKLKSQFKTLKFISNESSCYYKTFSINEKKYIFYMRENLFYRQTFTLKQVWPYANSLDEFILKTHQIN